MYNVQNQLYSTQLRENRLDINKIGGKMCIQKHAFLEYDFCSRAYKLNRVAITLLCYFHSPKITYTLYLMYARMILIKLDSCSVSKYISTIHQKFRIILLPEKRGTNPTVSGIYIRTTHAFPKSTRTLSAFMKCEYQTTRVALLRLCNAIHDHAHFASVQFAFVHVHVCMCVCIGSVTVMRGLPPQKLKLPVEQTV